MLTVRLPFASPWPEITAADLVAAHRQIASITRAVLAETRPVVGAAFDDVACRAFGIACFLSGMGPLMGRWTADGLIAPPGDLAEVLGRHIGASRRRSERLRHESIRVVHALNQRGIRPVVLKGAHTAYEYFEEPGLRPMSDVDLLVEPEHAARSQQVLVELGFRKQRQPGYPIRDRGTVWRHEDVSDTVRSWDCEDEGNPWTVDLHTSIDVQVQRGLRTRFGRLQFEHSQLSRWEGCDVRRFSPSLLALHLILHAGWDLTDVRLIRIVEIVRVIRKLVDDPAFDWSEFLRLAEETGAARLLIPGIELTERLAPGCVDSTTRTRLLTPATKRMYAMIDCVELTGFCGWAARGVGMRRKFVYSRGVQDLAIGCVEVLFPAGWRGRDYWMLQARRSRSILNPRRFIARLGCLSRSQTGARNRRTRDS